MNELTFHRAPFAGKRSAYLGRADATARRSRVQALEHCAFCEIAAGRSEQEVVYSNGPVVASLCEPPATWGHALVVPRAHRKDIWTIEPGEAAATIEAAQRLARAMREELGAVGVNLRQNSGLRAGQEVVHFHLHVVPRYDDDTVLPGCVWGAPPWQPPTGGKRERVAAALRRGLAA
jgi:histidine triad (HIT) family protein